MTNSEPRQIRVSVEFKPHAYDPAVNPGCSRRAGAACGRLPHRRSIIAIPVLFAAMFILVFGLVTLGLGWTLFLLFTPATIIWAVCYYGMTFGRPPGDDRHARHGLRMRTWYGTPAYFTERYGAVLDHMFDALAVDPCGRPVECRRRLLHDI
jgi:hypothetical protein